VSILNSETIRIAEAIARAVVALGPFDPVHAMYAAHSFAVACCRKAGGNDVDANAAMLLSTVGFDEDKAIVAIRHVMARRAELARREERGAA
jgi:hypothetical protein